MANLIPDIERIRAAKQKPTPGELYLLEYLQEKFDPTADIYFQPCINGDRPDIVIIKRNVGVVIVEVKDWDLDSYQVDEKNHWRVRSIDLQVRRPSAQAFHYKKAFFDIHVNGLLEKSLANSNFYNLITVLVYYHHANKAAVEALYFPAISTFKTQLKDNDRAFACGERDHSKYEREREFLSAKLHKLERDAYSVAVTRDSLKKIAFRSSRQNPLFTSDVYDEFVRLLSPPFHYAHEGVPIAYTKKQEELSQSIAGERIKIRGVAGSGKTSVLAKRAVNAHRRHGGDVLILTYNLTLRMYIHDKLSQVREDFPWSHFEITNYHRLIVSALANAGVEVTPSAEGERRTRDDYFEEEYFSNLGLFESLEACAHEVDGAFDRKGLVRYDTILIDEIQDYRPEWLMIIMKHFLTPGGELVVFGDEKQNIYGRPIDEEKKTRLPRGFGTWNELTKGFRNADNSHVLRIADAFQRKFLSDSHDIRSDPPFQPSLALVGINAWSCSDGNHASVAARVIAIAKQERIHPNDISIIGAHKKELQEIDYFIRTAERHKERTITTFEPKEASANSALSKHIKSIETQKKYGFNLNSGVIKLSTTHSFKGFESPTIFLIVGEKDQPEIVYTGLTRAKENLVVFVHQNSPFRGFFESHLEPLSSIQPS